MYRLPVEQCARIAAEAAYHEYWAGHHGNAFDLRDHVMAAYPPLQDDFFFSIVMVPNNRFNGGAIMYNCAESALTLALALVWEDKHVGKPLNQRPMVETLQTPALGGYTVLQMVRRLQRLKMLNFPVFEYDSAANEFHLLSGKAREDSMAILYVPVDAQMPVAHWTFGSIAYEEPEVVEVPDSNYVVYSSVPVVCDVTKNFTTYWRARVCPENIVEFNKMQALGYACDCSWDHVCNCETMYTRVIQAAPVPAHRTLHRVTMEGTVHVLGTQRAVPTKGLDGYKVSKVTDTRIKVTTPSGCEMFADGMAPNGAILAKGRFRTFWRYVQDGTVVSSQYIRMSYLHDRLCGNFRITLQLIDPLAETEMWKWRFVDFLPTGSLAGKLFLHKVVPALTPSNNLGPRTLLDVVPVSIVVPKKVWGATSDLGLRLPRKDELLARLAARPEVTEETAYDVLRRIANEEKWNVDLERDELRLWIMRVVTQKGQRVMLPAPTVKQCWTCLREVKTHRHECKLCRARARQSPPEGYIPLDCLVVHVGFRPLWSKEYELPESTICSTTKIYEGRRRGNLQLLWGSDPKVRAKFSKTAEFAQYLKKRMSPITCRGKLAGPMFLGKQPSCFPYGDATAMSAAITRIGSAREFEAQEEAYDRMTSWILGTGLIVPLEPMSWASFLARFSGAKREKYVEARKQVDEGWAPKRVEFSGFPKAERSYSTEYVAQIAMVEKTSERPRFICSPDPLVLALLGVYTQAQTMWLHDAFPAKSGNFYAGCSDPVELNWWLGDVNAMFHEPWVVDDDVSNMDSNHSEQSFKMHRKIRKIQFRNMSVVIEELYDGEEETLVIRVGRFKLVLKWRNGSGVPDTSYKNSILCIVIRAFATAHALYDLDTLSDEAVNTLLDTISRQSKAAAAGDDGKRYSGDYIAGVHMRDFNVKRYKEWWARAGFPVKVAITPPNRWRMGTFLAQRPVWNGRAYEWAPEPARRLQGCFWQIDSGLHPIAWARGVATQLRQQGAAHPVLFPIMDWYLKNTSGPVALDVETTNAYSPFAKAVSTGAVNERCINEFLVDYHLTKRDYDVFLGMLESTKDVLVNLDCQVLRAVYAEQS
jgi:hypothetical protein